jgi:L-2-hydroxycarboxylate dehydrogenase (NAD+)
VKAAVPRELRIDARILREWLSSAMELGGMTRGEAAITARVLTDADLRGLFSHGSVRVCQYLELVRTRRWCPGVEPEVLMRSASLTLMDGHHGVGPHLAMTAMQEAIERAREMGSAWVWLRNAGHFGPAGFYSVEAARAGMIGLTFTNSSPAMAAWGGRRPVLGANPWAIAIPRESEPWPIVLDMANTVVARGRVRAAAARGEELSPGLGLDAEGRPTTDPNAVLAGSLLSFGEYKGYALAFVVEALAAAVSGAAMATEVGGPEEGGDRPQRLGQAFAAVDVGRLLPLDLLSQQLNSLIETMQASEPRSKGTEILVPGEREAGLAEVQGREGIALPIEARSSISRAAGELGLDLPDGFQPPR